MRAGRELDSVPTEPTRYHQSKGVERLVSQVVGHATHPRKIAMAMGQMRQNMGHMFTCDMSDLSTQPPTPSPTMHPTTQATPKAGIMLHGLQTTEESGGLRGLRGVPVKSASTRLLFPDPFAKFEADFKRPVVEPWTGTPGISPSAAPQTWVHAFWYV